MQALVGLGFTAQNAGQAVTAVTAEEPTDAPLDQARTLRRSHPPRQQPIIAAHHRTHTPRSDQQPKTRTGL
ncbi:MAG TPA: RuvA C-terminal domain-containing protein [Pseudonocardia sp.]